MTKRRTKKRPPDWVESPLGDAEDDLADDHRVRIEPDERDDYEDWRRERGSRGRKRRDKAGGRHHRRRSHDDES